MDNSYPIDEWAKRFRDAPLETYYIKPYNSGEKDWAEKYLPEYFNDEEKIKNSHCLYAQK